MSTVSRIRTLGSFYLITPFADSAQDEHSCSSLGEIDLENGGMFHNSLQH